MKQLQKYKMFTVILIAGFALNFAACALTASNLKELSFNTQNLQGNYRFRTIRENKRDYNFIKKLLKIDTIIEDLPATSQLIYQFMSLLIGVKFWDADKEITGQAKYGMYSLSKTSIDRLKFEKMRPEA